MDHTSLFCRLRQEAGLWNKRSARDQQEEVCDWFGCLGWRQIGAGQFARVYRRAGENQVIKIFPLVGSAGEATMAYLQSCRRSKNPMMPRVDAVTRVGRVGVSVMEFLIPARGSVAVHAISMDVEAYFRSRSCRARSFVRADLSSYAQRAEGTCFHLAHLSRLVSTLRTLRSKTPGARIDLNVGNLMLRRTADGAQIVITDPMC